MNKFHPSLTTKSFADKQEVKSYIEQRISIDPITGCWNWTKSTDKDGYGKAKQGGKSIRAHRLSYIFYKGEITKGLCVCHKCDRPQCVNPDHLFLGSHADNEADKDAKGRRSPSPAISHPETMPRGSAHHKAKLTEKDVDLILQSKDSSYKLAKTFGIDPSTIQRIKKRIIWRHHNAAGFTEA